MGGCRRSTAVALAVALWATAALPATALLVATPGRADDSWNPFRQLNDEPRPVRRPSPAARDAAPVDGQASPAASDTMADRPGGQGTYGEAGGTSEPTAPPLRESDRGVERGELAPVMAGDGSGLPYELWRGLDVAAVEGLIARVDIPPRSPTLHGLWRRLITSEAGGPGSAGSRFAAVRAEALYRSGLVSDAAALIGRTPEGAEPAVAVLAARIEVAAGDSARGCERMKPLLARKAELPKPSQAELLALTGYCAAANGNPGGAGLAAELIREDRLDDPATLAALDAAAGGGKHAGRGGKSISLVHYRLHELGGGLDRGDVVQRGEAALLVRLALDSRTEPELRLMAAEAAAKVNALRPAELADIYRANGPSVAADALLSSAGGKRASASEQVLHRAAVLKAAEAERTPIRKVRLMRALVDDAKRAGLYGQALELLGPVSDSVQPVPELGWFAETGIEIGLATGNFARARQWASLGGAVPGDGGLRHWMALIDLGDPALKGERGRSLAAVEDLALRGRLAPDLLHRLATVLDAQDVSVPIPLWEAAGRAPQPTGGHLPDTGVLAELQDAAKKKEYGRTVLLVLRTIGGNGAEGANIIALGDAIRALRRAGLEAEARRLGLEALFPQWPRGTIN